MATPHIAAELGDFAPDILMPGDPRRAKRIAEDVLTDARLITDVRGILGYTGTFESRRVSVMASGMGQPSITIYATELFQFLGAKRIIRIGTAGGLSPKVAIGDVVVGTSAHTDSAMTAARIPGVHYSHAPSFALASAAVAAASAASSDGSKVHAGPLFSSDHFYLSRPELMAGLTAYGTLGVEMEAAALYAVAAEFDAEALAIVTVTDLIATGEGMSSDDRESKFLTAVSLGLAAFKNS
ncbi:purine-nucleoside phosphorylase [Nakamurella antarctica]|uniref:Purine-nucleoside phosphorylase n=1 Tax=Nakamurella antarctica TaxID=1902245 RepID=A0A3G8ZL73_9ACTN|nr:purine-nucleoside phosphorylase [Nakamurella antarctica]AZI57527.1 purine-nucleoside phosphorylase [Nakamurella antarctica]